MIVKSLLYCSKNNSTITKACLKTTLIANKIKKWYQHIHFFILVKMQHIFPKIEATDTVKITQLGPGAIVSSDVVNYTVLCSKITNNELFLIQKGLHSLFTELIDANKGILLSTQGDCFQFLIPKQETKSNFEALCTAIEISQQVIEMLNNLEFYNNFNLQMRFGISWGKVERQKYTMRGAPPMIFCYSEELSEAEKLEQTCEVGAVHISDSARRFLGNKSEFKIERAKVPNLKTFLLKNRFRKKYIRG